MLKRNIKTLHILATLLIITLPYQWVSLMSDSAFNLRLTHALLISSFISLLSMGRLSFGGNQLIRPLLWGFGFYLVAAIISIFFSIDVGLSLRAILKLLMGIFIFLSSFNLFSIAQLDEKKIVKAVIISVFLFMVTAELVFASQGRNFSLEFLKALFSGDASQLQFGFYTPLFNMGKESIRAGDSGFIATSFRNLVVGCFNLYFFLLLAFGANKTNITTKVLRKLAIGTCFLLIIGSVSRVNILTLFIGLILGFILKRSQNNRAKIRPILLGIGGLAIASVALASNADALFSVVGVLQERLGAIAEDGRLTMFDHAFEQINSYGILGRGIGVPLYEHVAREPVRIHNILLASWYEMGLIGLIASIGWLFAILALWIKSIRVITLRIKKGVISSSAIWLGSIPLFPVLRMFTSGDGGFPQIVELVSLGVFFSLSFFPPKSLQYDDPQKLDR